ncbi:MAG: hypothetical protein GX208_07380 [Firmicutes bacterium]|nr:hypothetical protein [Bacillota bacterium]
MFWQFLRHLVFAIIILVMLSLMIQVNLPYTQELRDYLYFVLTTDFQVDSLLAPVQSVLDLVPIRR